MQPTTHPPHPEPTAPPRAHLCMDSAEYIFLNLFPITAAAAASFLWGALWYYLLRRPYSRAVGESVHRRPLSTYALVFALEWWLAAILIGALILAPVEAGRWTVGLGSAFIIWVGFVLPATVINTRLQPRPWSLALIDAGHWLGAMLVQAVVMLLVGTTAP